MDPISISTGQGKGLAQVLPSSGKSPYDLYTDYLKVKGTKEAAKKKEVVDVFQGLEDIKLGGFVKDTQYLYDMKNQLQGHLKNQYVQQGNKYNYVTDEKLIKDVNKLKELNQFSENTKGLFNAELTKLQTGKDQWDPTSVEQVTTFYNLPIEERYEYINNGGAIPTLRPKQEVVNYIDEINKFDTPYKTRSGETGSKDGRIGTYDITEVDEGKLGDLAERYWTAGQNNASKGAQKLFEVVKAKVDQDPNFVLMTEQERAQKIKNVFTDEFKKIKLSQAKDERKTGSKQDMTGLSFGNGMASNNKYTFVYEEGIEDRPSQFPTTALEQAKGKTKEYQKIRFQRNDAGENRPLVFSDPTSQDPNHKSEVIPTEFKKSDGEWKLVGVQRKSNGKVKEIEIPASKVQADFKSSYGVSLNELLDGGIAKGGNMNTVKTGGRKLHYNK